MTTWSTGELSALDLVESIRLEASSPPNPANNGVELGIVIVGDGAYVRAYRGTDSTWFRSALMIGRGTIVGDEFRAHVRFDLAVSEIADQVDAAYRSKYGRRGAAALGLVLSSNARAATLRVTPDRRDEPGK